MQKATKDYRNIKDELYLTEKDKNFSENNLLDNIVKQEDDHKENPVIDYTMMKVMKLDEESTIYMVQKWFKNGLSGLVGKIFDMDESNIEPIKMPGQARCRYCDCMFASWRVKKRHEQTMGCIKGLEYTVVNRNHQQHRSNHELVWGDQILLHSAMSINKINF